MGTPNTTEQDPLASLRLALADPCVALDSPSPRPWGRAATDRFHIAIGHGVGPGYRLRMNSYRPQGC